MTQQVPKHSPRGVELVRLLGAAGVRIFTTDSARKVAAAVGLSEPYIPEALHHLRKTGWIVPVRRGLYAISTFTPGVADVHEYEVAMALVDPAAISHWSAMHFHGLTMQIPRTVFVLTTSRTRLPRSSPSRGSRPSGLDLAARTPYRFIQVKPERYFGTQAAWLGESRIIVTDPERTLVDGLSRPWFCGGFGEVMTAFEARMAQLQLDRIIEYALKLDVATAKRLGWVLQNLGVSQDDLSRLQQVPIKSVRRLVADGPNQGPYDRRWMLRINLPGSRRG